MKLSIITPTYNRPKQTERVIANIKQLNAPAGFTFEHILIDDGSTDTTPEIIKKKTHSKLKPLFLNKNKGVNGARNAGIKKAKGEYILFLDSDDKLKKNTLYEIQKILKKNSQKIIFFETEQNGKTLTKNAIYNQNIDFKTYLSSKIEGEFLPLINSKIFQSIKFNENMLAFESYFWNQAFKEFGPGIIIPQQLRIYDNSGEDRLCKQLLKSKNIKKRSKDYINYILTYKQDYLKFNLTKELGQKYTIAGIYMIAAEELNAKNYLKKGKNYSQNLTSTILYYISFLGKKPFIKIIEFLRLNA